MNAPILKLFVLVLVLFTALVGMTSWNSVINAKEYRDNKLNARTQIEQQRVRRGIIRARDNTVLARSVQGSDTLYRRRYTPEARLFAHALGYAFLRIGRAGLERSRNSALAGEQNALTSVVDQLRGKRREGDNVVTNLDPAAQEVARDPLRARIEVRDDVVALAELAAQLVDDRRQLVLLAGERGVARALEAGAPDAQEVVADRVSEEPRLGRVAAAVQGVAGLHRVGEQRVVAGADDAAVHALLLDLRARVQGVLAVRLGIDDAVVARHADERGEEHQHEPEELEDRRVHASSASRRARSETSSSSASRMKLATIEEPP